jgi:hypothetical protein
LGILAASLAVMLAAFLLVLALPVELSVRVRREAGKGALQGQLRALGGLVRLPLSRTHRQRRPRRQQRQHRQRRHGRSRPRAVLRERDLFARFVRLLRRLLHRIRFEHLELQARVGLGDPADTGRAWAVLGPAGVLLAALPRARIRIDPDFTAEVFELDGSGRVRVVPLVLIAELLAFALAPANLATWFRLARSRP